MNSTINMIIDSWCESKKCINSIEEILNWIEEKNKNLKVDIQKINLSESTSWSYSEEDGAIQNQNKSFFQIKGLVTRNGEKIKEEQPIIIQNEIGYLGILCKEIEGTLYFLMQAKIEPGNINKIQISPTIQATKSNFMQKHGGAKPSYLEYFSGVKEDDIIVDQIQSEQSSRFYKKRNRNIIIKTSSDVEVLDSHKWMTLGQIKQLMKIDNLVNMDTRTVLACIPFCMGTFNTNELKSLENKFKDKSLFKSLFVSQDTTVISRIYNYINNIKMYDEFINEFVPLHMLKNWNMNDSEIVCKEEYPFKVIFCNIAIEGREVQRWTQPLFEAIGMAKFGLFTCEEKGIKKFLVRIKPEVGCFDKVEIGPTIQLEPNQDNKELDDVEKLFYEKMERKENIITEVVLSEEGGRFYHEQNKNIIIQIDKEQLGHLPKGYFWVDYYTLNLLTQVNNCLNIQLRNLLSLLEA